MDGAITVVMWWVAAGAAVSLFVLFMHELRIRALKRRNEELEGINAVLNEQIAEHERAEQEVRQLAGELEQRVEAKTVDLEMANEELAGFSHSISHDLRAPLHAIIGFSNALIEDNEDQLDETGKDMLTRITSAGKRMGGMIDGLLRLSRLSGVGLRVVDVDLSALAVETLEELQRADPERRVETTIEAEIHTKADLQMARVLMRNLIGNAWKFTAGRNPGAIEFGCREIDGERHFVVRDNGVGFSMAQADRLFRPFQRLHSNRAFPGMGIGLATVHRIIQRHDGSITIDGRPDEGTTVTFTLHALLD